MSGGYAVAKMVQERPQAAGRPYRHTEAALEADQVVGEATTTISVAGEAAVVQEQVAVRDRLRTGVNRYPRTRTVTIAAAGVILRIVALPPKWTHTPEPSTVVLDWLMSLRGNILDSLLLLFCTPDKF